MSCGRPPRDDSRADSGSPLWRWRAWPAATARRHLAQVRVERLSKPLTIQRKRFELGEISGSERRQVELEHARETAILQQVEAMRLAVERELEVLAHPASRARPIRARPNDSKIVLTPCRISAAAASSDVDSSSQQQWR